MPDLKISRVAKQFGLRASALRYYEHIGVLPASHRRSGQRMYDESAIRRLAIVQRARDLGFTIKEIQVLFSEFSSGPPVSERWHSLCGTKLEELEERIGQIHEMQRMLRKMMNCRCTAFEECGEGILRAKCKLKVEQSAACDETSSR
jgi:MerR family redox-sensitive transcriptional activator SoxR